MSLTNNSDNFKKLELRILELENQNHTCSANYTNYTYHTSEIIENSFNDTDLNNSIKDLQEQISKLREDMINLIQVEINEHENPKEEFKIPQLNEEDMKLIK